MSEHNHHPSLTPGPEGDVLIGCCFKCVHVAVCICAYACVFSDHPQLFTDQSNCLDRLVIYRYTPPPSLPSSLLPLNISHDTHLSADKHTEEKLYIHSKTFIHTHTHTQAAQTYLQRENSQGRNGYNGGHEEGSHVVDRCQSDAVAGATQAVSHPLLSNQTQISLRKGGR